MVTMPWPLNSRKGIAATAGIIVTLVLLATGQIDGDTAANLIAGQIAVLIGSIAWEDAAAKQGGRATVTLPGGGADSGTTTTQATITSTNTPPETDTAVTTNILDEGGLNPIPDRVITTEYRPVTLSPGVVPHGVGSNG